MTKAENVVLLNYKPLLPYRNGKTNKQLRLRDEGIEITESSGPYLVHDGSNVTMEEKPQADDPTEQECSAVRSFYGSCTNPRPVVGEFSRHFCVR